MNRHDGKAIRGAMGRQDGDYIKLENQWGKVIIAWEDGKYVVAGDLVDLRVNEKTFATETEAMAYALRSLKSVEQGALR